MPTNSRTPAALTTNPIQRHWQHCYASGVDAATLATALQSIAEVKQSTAPAPDADKSIYQEKELVYDDECAYIYRRGDTKRRIYYLRIYDNNSKEPYVKSLQTTDR